MGEMLEILRDVAGDDLTPEVIKLLTRHNRATSRRIRERYQPRMWEDGLVREGLMNPRRHAIPRSQNELVVVRGDRVEVDVLLEIISWELLYSHRVVARDPLAAIVGNPAITDPIPKDVLLALLNFYAIVAPLIDDEVLFLDELYPVRSFRVTSTWPRDISLWLRNEAQAELNAIAQSDGVQPLSASANANWIYYESALARNCGADIILDDYCRQIDYLAARLIPLTTRATLTGETLGSPHDEIAREAHGLGIGGYSEPRQQPDSGDEPALDEYLPRFRRAFEAIVLPSVTDLPSSDLLSVRRSDAFERWRSDLSAAVDQILIREELPWERRETAFRHELSDAADKVEREFQRSGLLAAVRAGSLSMTVGAAVSAATALVWGPEAGGQAALAAGATAAVDLARSARRRRDPALQNHYRLVLGRRLLA